MVYCTLLHASMAYTLQNKNDLPTSHVKRHCKYSTHLRGIEPVVLHWFQSEFLEHCATDISLLRNYFLYMKTRQRRPRSRSCQDQSSKLANFKNYPSINSSSSNLKSNYHPIVFPAKFGTGTCQFQYYNCIFLQTDLE